MTDIIPPRYNFSEVEETIYEKWMHKKCFQAAFDLEGNIVDEKRAKAETFTIAIPPPNVTGRLHMGHALNNTIQDVLIRYKRMCGYDALWIPGTDHAGIATQNVVKKMLDKKGMDYREIGREKFIEYVWEWKEKYGSFILNQLKKMGCSCDWQRTRFTMDEGLSRAVNRSFKTLYDQGLIYRGKRIVNWCPVDRTALSDDEVETKEGGESGHLWHIKYPIIGTDEFLVVATTRPETLFGDVAVAVHPEDERYQKYIGKNVKLPLTEKEIPIISDEYVDKDFGTGCVKITPAHDPNDFEVGKRHNLEPINIMNEDASMNQLVPEKYQGMDRYKCRRETVKDLKEQELLEKEQKYKVPLGRSYRSKAVIEYRLSEQWFVKMDTLTKKALERHDELSILPMRWNKVYFHWLNNIRDWCISRQIWWGHRIPAWYHKETGKILVAEETPKEVEDNPEAWHREEDVLDTWFSSALWPMSTLGWPQKTPDFNRYFPTSALSTAKDIIFFWVARMNFSSLEFEDTFPYKNVYIHPTILDENGETMSKSKGNGIDPLSVMHGASLEDLKQPVLDASPNDMKQRLSRIEKRFPDGFEGVGADAMRYTLLSQCSTGQEIRLALDSFQEIGRRFMTKLWNAARFVFLYIEQEKEKGGENPNDFSQHYSDEDLWIQGKIQIAALNLRKNLDNYDFSHVGDTYYQLIWNDFCDWYVELCKARLTSEDSLQRKTALHCLITALADILHLFHPVAPFITEELWNKLLKLGKENNLWGNKLPKSELLIVSDFPLGGEPKDYRVIDKFSKLQDIVTMIRTLRADYGIRPIQKLTAYVLPITETCKSLVTEKESHRSLLRLAGLDSFDVVTKRPEKTVTIIDSGCEIYVDIHEFVDITKELERLQKEMAQVEKYIATISKKLDNRNFVERAQSEIVAAERAKLEENQQKLDKLQILHGQFTNF